MSAAAPTAGQISYMLSFLQENSSLARGFLRSVEGRVRSKRLWEELTRQLNAIGGAQKTMKQWQKVWSDRKYLTKKAVSASKESTSRTGGGPSSAGVLIDTELKIVNIMGEGLGESDTSVSVPAFPTLPVQAMRSEPVEVPGFDDSEDTQIITEDDPLSPETDEAPAAVAPAPGPQRRQRVRQRQVSQEGSFRSRLFRMEEERVAAEELRAQQLIAIRQELSAIRESMDTLVNVLQIYVYRDYDRLNK